MGDITLSGYKAEESSIAWTSGQALNSLTDNETTDLSDEIDNSSNKYALDDLVINLASAAFNGTDCALEIYVVHSVEDTPNYPTWDGNTTSPGNANANYRVRTVAIKAATAACIITVKDIPLPNGKFKYAFRSRANVALAGSGNTAKRRPHQLTVN